MLIFTVFPIIYSIGGSNHYATNTAKLLQANNLAANTTEDCDYLLNAVYSWLAGATLEVSQEGWHFAYQHDDVFVLWAQLLPVRCPWQRVDGSVPISGVITVCPRAVYADYEEICSFWNSTAPLLPSEATTDYFAAELGTRAGGLLDLSYSEVAPADFNDGLSDAVFSVRVIASENHTLSMT